ncbi:MAG TPA: outer membrane beta-barrel protein [Burkholderiales bacterium]|nr:outer membrane beta-barrel protein [Burkholderiales bacterium]
MKKGRWLVGLGLLAVAAAGPVAAQPTKGLYAGASIGYSQFKDICDVVVAGVSCDDNDTAWRAFGGYQFNEYLALEFGFANLGAATGSGAPGSFSAEVKEAFDLSALFTIPVATRLSLLLRLGANRTRTTVDQQGPSFGSLHEAKTGSSFTLGAGAEYSFGKLGLRAEWLHYDNVATGTVAENDIDVLSVGVLFRF